MVLVRNDKWTAGQRPVPQGLPGLVGGRLRYRATRSSTSASSRAPPADQTAISTLLTPESLPVVFNDPKFADRRINEFDPYVRYFAINVKKVPNLKHRMAMAVALDREALRTNAGGAYAGDYADGVIKPNMGQDYAPTEMWNGLLGQTIPDTGDAGVREEADRRVGRRRCRRSPSTTRTRPTNTKAAAIIIASLAKAGITAKPNPIEPGQYYGVVFDPEKAHELINAGWGPDWPNASTIIPELFTPTGGFNLSQFDDQAFNDADRQGRSSSSTVPSRPRMWQDLNTEAMKQVVVDPDPLRSRPAPARLEDRQRVPAGRPTARGRTATCTSAPADLARHARDAWGRGFCPAPTPRAASLGETPARRSRSVSRYRKGTPLERLHRTATPRHDPHAAAADAGRLPAVQRAADRSGTPDLREGLHAGDHRGQPAPARSRPAPSGSSTGSSSRASSSDAPTAPAPQTFECSAPCLGYSFKRGEEVTVLIKDRFPATMWLAIGAFVLWIIVGVSRRHLRRAAPRQAGRTRPS